MKIAEKLEEKLDSHLHRARITNSSNLAKSRAGDVRAGEASEIRVIENIENFATQLQPHIFRELDGSGQCEVKALGSGAIDDASPCRSRRGRQPGCGGSRVGLETSGVEKLLRRLRRSAVRIAKQIRASSWIRVDQSHASVIKV